MSFNIEATIWYAVLLDSIGANIVAWFCADWYRGNLEAIYKHFPATRGWCFVYLMLVLWVGCVLYRLEVLPW
jgi:phosphotransferase system  glucose/maltose/N-acetylglucosamine-specific IIC component